MLYKSGLFMEGVFKAGVPEGEGIILFPNGVEHVGIFKKGILEGAGQITIMGICYKGKFKKGIFEGDNVFTNESNQHFVFDSKNERLLKIGIVKIYLNMGYKLIGCKWEKDKIMNGNCIFEDDLNCQWEGRIKYTGVKD